eukprot:9422289-Pyramimonas_sp.AAC.1
MEDKPATTPADPTPRTLSTDLSTQVNLPHMANARQKTVAKILQSHDEYGMLVEAPTGQLFTFVGRSMTWLQNLDRTTAE